MSEKDSRRAGKEETRLRELLEEVAYPRIGNAIKHKLKDALFIGLLCILCNGDTYTDMELFGETHEELLREFLELPYGIPSHDTFGDIFSRLDPAQLSSCFSQWVEGIKAEMEGHVRTLHADSRSIHVSRTTS